MVTTKSRTDDPDVAFGARLRRIHSPVAAAKASPDTQQRDTLHEELLAMFDCFVGPEYSREKVERVETLQRRLHMKQTVLAELLSEGVISDETYVDRFNADLRRTFEQCQAVLGAADFQALFGCDLDGAQGYIDKATFTHRAAPTPASVGDPHPAKGSVSSQSQEGSFDLAVSLALSLREASAPVPQLLQTMMDEVDYGLLLVGVGSQVRYMNEAARANLREPDHPLQLHGNELRARWQKDVAPLSQALHAATSLGVRKLLTLGAVGKRASFLALPLGVSSSISAGTSPRTLATLLVLGRREAPGERLVRAFSQENRLSPSEKRVLAELCQGRALAEIAEQQGSKLATVRTQIANIRAKTGAKSIRDLVQQAGQPMIELPQALLDIFRE